MAEPLTLGGGHQGLFDIGYILAADTVQGREAFLSCFPACMLPRSKITGGIWQ
jgi:hypothetical protein